MPRKVREPNFFIVGSAKSGTTSLAHYIGQHPDAFMCPLKESHYFSSAFGSSDFGLSNLDEYLLLFSKAGDATAVGEASTGYLFDVASAETIYEKFPEGKILIILRNPAEMVFSHWRHTSLKGNESRMFEEAISASERKYRKTEEFKHDVSDWRVSHFYLERAMYWAQVKRYMDVFGSDNVKVWIFEEFFAKPEESCRDVFSFLNIDHSFTPDCLVVNKGGMPRFQLLKSLMNRKHPTLKRIFPPTVRKRIRMTVQQLNTKKGYQTMNHGMRKKLEGFFRDDVENLEKLLGREITAWKPHLQ